MTLLEQYDAIVTVQKLAHRPLFRECYGPAQADQLIKDLQQAETAMADIVELAPGGPDAVI